MSEVKELHRGDPCPACGGALVAAYVPSADEFRRAFDRENPIALRPGSDTANAEQRAEHGDLFRCDQCGYTARFKSEAATGSVPASA